MNKLTISDGGYVLVRDWDGNVLEGESSNLLGVFDTDTITVLDQAYNRKPIAILNCLYTDIELNGTTYGSLTELEGAFNEAIDKSEGGGSKVEIVDELPETGEDGVFYVISGSKSVYLYTESEGYVVIEDNTGNDMYVLEVDDYTGQVRLDGETVGFDVVESLFTNNPGKVVMKARYMNATFILYPFYTIDNIYFVSNVVMGNDFGVLTYMLAKGASVVTVKTLTPEMLYNKADSIMEEFDPSQVGMYPTIYAVLNFVYGQGYAKWLQVDELPTEGRNIDKNVYVIRTDDDFDFYKMLRNSHGSPFWYKIGSSKTMEQAVLYYDGESNTIKDEAGNVLTMEQIINLVKDKTKFVYLRDDAVLCLPSLDFYEDAFEFTGTYVMNGYTTTARVIINSNNEVSEYHLTNEKTENKVTTLANADDETYPTTNAVKTYVDGKIWNGTEDELPAPEDQIEGVIYLVHE